MNIIQGLFLYSLGVRFIFLPLQKCKKVKCDHYSIIPIVLPKLIENKKT